MGNSERVISEQSEKTFIYPLGCRGQISGKVTSTAYIYSNGSKLNNKVIIDRCRKINATDIPPVFFIIQFYASEDGTLQSIKAKYFDSKARVIHIESIYQAAKVIKLTA